MVLAYQVRGTSELGLLSRSSVHKVLVHTTALVCTGIIQVFVSRKHSSSPTLVVSLIVLVSQSIPVRHRCRRQHEYSSLLDGVVASIIYPAKTTSVAYFRALHWFRLPWMGKLCLSFVR